MLTRSLLVLFIFVAPNFGQQDERPLVTTPLGRISGFIKKSSKDLTFSAFESIPYGKPPVGDRRFKEPEPVGPWEGVWNANFRTRCAQTDLIHPHRIQGDEDCLHLSVYVPREVPNPDEKLQVIVHLHGGGFMSGSVYSYAYDPGNFMDHDVVFVSLNYRLGILGFLSTEDDVVPGNNGLKDQVLALKWVRDNIASFGGDPDSVTLTGASSGAASVHLHYFSDLSKGLFHRGFSQSGTALNPSSIQDQPLIKTKVIAASLGCPTSENKVMVDCLRQRPHKEILRKVSLFHGYKFTPTSPFGPVIEKGSNSFINKNPYYLLAKGFIQDLPWLTSNTAHEGMFPGIYFLKDLDTINDNWTSIAPFLLDYNYTLATPLKKSAADKIKEFYLGENEEINENNFWKFIQMLSDRLFLVDVENALKWQAKRNAAPVYYYSFGYPGSHTFNNSVAHVEDAQYLFSRRNENAEGLQMKEVLLDILISFARTGVPQIEGVNWEPVQNNQIKFLNVTSHKKEDLKIESMKNLAPGQFWYSLGFLENQNLVLIKDEL